MTTKNITGNAVIKRQKISFRPLLETDLEWIRTICIASENFTIPPKYVFWMLLRTQAKFCQTFTVNNEVISYFLATTTNKKDEIFIWQMGMINIQKYKYLYLNFWKHYFEILKENNIRNISFTISEKKLKLCSHILHALELHGKVVQTGKCYKTEDILEYEYMYELKY